MISSATIIQAKMTLIESISTFILLVCAVINKRGTNISPPMMPLKKGSMIAFPISKSIEKNHILYVDIIYQNKYGIKINRNSNQSHVTFLCLPINLINMMRGIVGIK